MRNAHIKCPVCGIYEFQEEYDYCPECGWCNDLSQLDFPDEDRLGNRLSLNQARKAYALGRMDLLRFQDPRVEIVPLEGAEGFLAGLTLSEMTLIGELKSELRCGAGATSDGGGKETSEQKRYRKLMYESFEYASGKDILAAWEYLSGVSFEDEDRERVRAGLVEKIERFAKESV